MGWGHDERDYAAGRSDQGPRLSEGAWADMVANVRAIACLARGRLGVRAVFHPHAGGYIEFADEVERIAADVPPDEAGFCIDTGHSLRAGMDPVETLRCTADRLDDVHFKDIDPAVFEAVTGERIRFFEVCARGMMRPVGRGGVGRPAQQHASPVASPSRGPRWSVASVWSARSRSASRWPRPRSCSISRAIAAGRSADAVWVDYR